MGEAEAWLQREGNAGEGKLPNGGRVGTASRHSRIEVGAWLCRALLGRRTRCYRVPTWSKKPHGWAACL